MTQKDNLDEFATLVDIIARLRGPQGCPWDREQTHLSLKPNLVEECYEVIEAIDQGDSRKLSEELGDLLMQIVLHAEIAAEQGNFNIKEVLQKINAKLIHRHPHVFGEVKIKDAHEVVLSWEALKREERGGSSPLSGLPKGMPALAYSQAVQRRAARVGFDWKEISEIMEKLVEEVQELRQAINHQQRVQEFGDLLFTLANIARRLDIDLEEALRLANERFYCRFSYMEEVCCQQGISLDSLSLEEQDKLWQEAKQNRGGQI
jgi:tetrapyrrole methylase family protein/MazG family protein